jgi:ribosomal protein S18 acetylase RimI-like enzyme
MIVRLRATRPEDLGYVTALERDEYNRRFIGQWTDAEHVAAIRGDAAREHRVIEVDGAPCGYVICYRGEAISPSVYIKRLLVAEKERGVGQAAMAELLDTLFARADVDFAWLLVRQWNERAQAVYRRLGFVPYDPAPLEAAALARYAEAPGAESFRMRLDAARWRGEPR